MRRLLFPTAAALLAACSGNRKAAAPRQIAAPQAPGFSQNKTEDALAKTEPASPEPLFAEQRYLDALRAAQEGALEPDAAYRFDRLSKLLAAMGLQSLPEREEALRGDGVSAHLAHEAVSAFMAERDREAVLLAAAASGSSQEESFRLLLQSLEALTSRRAEAGEVQTIPRIIDYKLRRANGLFSENRFEDAARECEDAVRLDPENPRARERLGSMLFAIGRHKEAEDAWRHALALDPENPALKDFLSRFELQRPQGTSP